MVLFMITLHGQGDKEVDADLLFKEFISALEEEKDIFFIYESTLLDGLSSVPKDLIEGDLSTIFLVLSRDYLVEVHQISNQTFALRSTSHVGHIRGRVYDEHGRPLAGATIFLPAVRKGTSTSLDGSYLPRSGSGHLEYKVLLCGRKDVVLTKSVGVGDAIEADINLLEQPYLQEVTIIGSRISPSSVINNATLVTMTDATIESNQWYSDLGEMLQYNVPSFHSTQQTIADGTDHINPASLRGLGPDQVLVLINGKRRHQSSLVNINGTVGKGTVSTDLSAIPISAIEKIEVLQDGGAVQYGSDAIAGVINIILKEDAAYSESSIKMGIAQSGDGEILDLSGHYGIDLTKKGGHVDMFFQFVERGAVNRSDAYTDLYLVMIVIWIQLKERHFFNRLDMTTIES